MVIIGSEIVLYSTGCPKCKVLMKKLGSKGLEYTENKSMEDMKKLGIKSAPVLSVDGELLDFRSAIRWVDKQ